mmetsp:Transcript_5842/g.21313  ORF Transcript_5842/g.21313 Transcript_5842/m.21313 type:complete len:80 (+) Transcript_5842:793-1032(+)
MDAFKQGAFSVAVKAGVRVVPVTLLGTGDLMPSGQESRLKAGKVKLVIHEPIGGGDAKQMCEEARAVIAAELTKYGYEV